MSKRQRKQQFIIISEEAASDMYKKVVRVKELLANDADLSVNQACKDVGISRSAYYKYRDAVYQYVQINKNQVYQYRMLADFCPAFLKSFAGILEAYPGTIVQFSQQIDTHSLSRVNFSLQLASQKEAKALFSDLEKIRGVEKLELQLPL